MKKTIKQIIEEGYNLNLMSPGKYFNQEVYTKGELVRERIKGRQQVIDNPETYGLTKGDDNVPKN